MPNQLAHETSPYLLQHAGNPVDWYPWGAEAIERARRENKPIFLSIGYSACHWCHVMEHESFEDPEIARALNERFISIKVDREERPDLDHVYMEAVQQLTGRGGWPMSVFLTPDLKPFFGGTYWPPRQRQGMPGFDQVLQAVDHWWHHERDKVDERGEQLAELLGRPAAVDRQAGALDEGLFDDAAGRLEQQFDSTHGGFGGAPKFPHAMTLQWLLRYWRRRRRDRLLEMVTLTLERMARGGIYDHLGGGFHRYSVDQRWLVPHFEKMLYDNALLADAYLDGYLATGRSALAAVARETLDYLLRDMADPEGGFHSTEDADSEGEEGKFYVWTPDEVRAVLGAERAERFNYVYDVSEQGNFEGRSVLNLPKTVEQCAALRGWELEPLYDELDACRAELLEARSQRARPARDDKILTSWNALAIHSLARAAQILDEPRYLEAATVAARFLHDHLRRDDGRLLHAWRRGTARVDGFLDDYAYLINALLSLYESGFDERWVVEADGLARVLLERFADPETGRFFYTADDHEPLVARVQDMQDGSVPSGNAMAATGLLRLGKLTGCRDYVEAAERVLQSCRSFMQQAPSAASQLLIAADMLVGPMYEIAVLGNIHERHTEETLTDLRQRYLPNYVLACRREPEPVDGARQLHPLFEGKEPLDAEPTVFVCERFTCRQPVAGTEAVEALWDHLEQTGQRPGDHGA